MALVSKLIESGLSRRQAEALGFHFEAINAAGSTQSDATLITESITFVIGADGTKGVRLPKFDESKTGLHLVINFFGFILKIYPASGERGQIGVVNEPFLAPLGTITMILRSKLDFGTPVDAWTAFSANHTPTASYP